MMTDFTSTAVEACSFVFFIFHNFPDLSLALLGLCCRLGFSSCGEQGLASRGGAQASPAPAPPVGEHRLRGIGALSSCGTWALQSPWRWECQAPGLRVVVQRLSCSQACGIFLDQGLNLCFLHRQANSLPLNHQGSLKPAPFFNFILIGG